MVNVEKLTAAIKVMGYGFGSNEALGSLTCLEARSLVEVFILAGFPDLAADAYVSHGIGDSEETDEHHDLYQDPNKVTAMAHVRKVAESIGVDL